MISSYGLDLYSTTQQPSSSRIRIIVIGSRELLELWTSAYWDIGVAIDICGPPTKIRWYETPKGSYGYGSYGFQMRELEQALVLCNYVVS